MRNLFLLIRPRFLGLKNRLTHAERGKRKRVIFLGALALAFCIGLFVLSCRFLIYLQSVEVIGDLLARHLLSMVLLTFFCLLIFSNIITGLSNLYLSRDLDLCLTTPVIQEELLASRAALTFMDSSWMLILFGMPVFMAYGYVYGAGLEFYAAVLHLNLAMAIIAAGVGLLVTIILVYIFPANRTRDVTGLLAVFTLVALYLLFRFLRPEKLVDPEAFFSLMEYLSALKALHSPYLPTQWITLALWDILKGPGREGHLFSMLITWNTAVAISVVAVWVARALYFEGLSKSQEAKKRRTGARRVLDLLVSGLTLPFGEELAAVFAKDIRNFFRDNTQWSQTLIVGALVVVYVYNYSVLPLDKAPIRIELLQNQLAFLNMGLAGFVLAAVSARFVFPAVSAEGQAYWIIRSSPLSLRRFLWGKYLFFLMPMLLLAEVLVLATNHLLHVNHFVMVLTASTTFCMVFGIVALGVGLGAVYRRFRYENIAQVATGLGGMLYMILSVIFIVLVILLEAAPAYILFMSGVRGTEVGLIQWLIIVACFSAVIALHAVAVFKPMRKGIRALEEGEGN